MSMSTHIVGFIPPDEKWQKMKAVWDACEDVGVDITDIGVDVPDMVRKFFNDEYPDLHGVKIDLEDVAERYTGIGKSGYELNVKDIPEHVKVLRFYNSW